jgi:hypothetical protein
MSGSRFHLPPSGKKERESISFFIAATEKRGGSYYEQILKVALAANKSLKKI